MSNVSQTAANPPAGWYHDPLEPSVLRYWTGAEWTTQMQPAGQAAEVPRPLLTNRMALGLVVALLVVATLAFVVLGGESDGGSSSASVNPAQAEQLDLEAQSQVRLAQTAVETYSTDHAGEYTGATPEALAQIEGGLTAPLTVEAQGTSYTLTVESETGSSFVVTKDASNVLTYTCSPAGAGACPDSGNWAE